MAILQKDTLAVNTETLCELRVPRTCNKEVGDEIKLSNKLLYRIVSIESDKIFVEYAEQIFYTPTHI